MIAALTFVGVNLITPRFKSEARVLIDTRENVFLRPEAEKNPMDRGRAVDLAAVHSQVRLAARGAISRGRSSGSPKIPS